MSNIKNGFQGGSINPKYLNYFYQFEILDNSNWLSFDLGTASSDEGSVKYLKPTSVVRLMHSQNMILQKKETNVKNQSLRIAMQKRHEQRFVGSFKDSRDCSIVLIKHEQKRIVEVFLSLTVKSNCYALLQLLDNGELEDEILFHRISRANDLTERQINKEVIITETVIYK